MKTIVTTAYVHKVAALDDRARGVLHAFKLDLVEQVNSGPYELYLFYDNNLRVHQVGLQRDDTQCTSVEQQQTKMPLHEKTCEVDLKKIKDTIASWQAEHGELMLSSLNPRKTEKYANILKWLGVDTYKKNIGGYSVYYVGNKQS